ncbi:MAG: aminotransferase class V-fold PLP-dependent enzyme [Anaerolineae bacterium]|nr:aminotransferase class V-fold PLP-dependent enzyme [Anaerolineae bacterium]
MEHLPTGVSQQGLENQATGDWAAFLRAYPAYASTTPLDELRTREYSRLDRLGQVYLDYTGGSLYADCQLRSHQELLSAHVFGNPHSHNPTSLAMTRHVEQARAYVLEFFNADPDEYEAIFTLNASGALKLVGEAYPFAPGGYYALLFDNHNSVNGIREFARAKGAQVSYVAVDAPDLRINQRQLEHALALGTPGIPKLFAYPAQSNYSGVQHPLELIEVAQAQGWEVLVDCAAFAPTNRLDLHVWKPDYLPLSFYKMFGYPTGAGVLLARKSALAKLHRPWYAGGTITIASVQGNGHYFAEGAAAFEDGTVNYLNLPAVEIGLRHLESVGIEMIHTRVICLTGWLLERLTAMKHSNGHPLVRVHGPNTLEARGGTLTLTFFDPDGVVFDEHRVEELANLENISVRTGCFCNPGAGEVAHGLTPEMMAEFFKYDHGLSFEELRQLMQARYGKSINAVRISVGLASNFADVQRFLDFAQGLIDQSVTALGDAKPANRLCGIDAGA